MRLVEVKGFRFEELSSEVKDRLLEGWRQERSETWFCYGDLEEAFGEWLVREGLEDQAEKHGWKIKELSFDYSHLPELVVEDKDEKVIMSMEVGMNGSRGDDLAVELFDYLEKDYNYHTSDEALKDINVSGGWELFTEIGDRLPDSSWNHEEIGLTKKEMIDRLNYLLIKRYDLEKQGKMLSKNQVKELAELKAGLLG